MKKSLLLPNFHRNARTSILTEPLWAIFGTAALFYLVLFMKESGLSTIEIGIIISINLYVSCLVQILAGPIVNRLGRKKATFLFDITSWVIPMAIWAFSDNFWFFLVGYILNATSKVVNVSFWLLATEDSPENERPRVFAAVKMIILVAGLLVPVVGLFIEGFGELPTFRVLFVLGAVAMLAHNLIRNAYSDETTAGVRAMHTHKGTTLIKGVHESWRLLVASTHNKLLRRVLMFYTATYLAFAINIFQAVYLSRDLGFPAVIVGSVPAVAAVAAILCFMFVMPRVELKLSLGRLALVSTLLTCIGWAMFLFVGPEGAMLLLPAVFIANAGMFALESYRDALVVSCVHEEERAGLFAAVQSLTGIVSIPAGIVAALLFEVDPKLLFVTVLGLYVLALLSASGKTFSTTVTEKLLPVAEAVPARF